MVYFEGSLLAAHNGKKLKGKLMNNHIHWYPGHIAKAERLLKEKLNLVDVILEVLDARIPISSAYGNTKTLFQNKPRIILLNKCDLSDSNENLKWKKILEEKTGAICLLTTNSGAKDTNLIINKIIEISKPVIDKMVSKGLFTAPNKGYGCGNAKCRQIKYNKSSNQKIKNKNRRKGRSNKAAVGSGYMKRLSF